LAVEAATACARLPAVGRGALDRLTSLRAFAALSVFLFHLGNDHLWPGANVFPLTFGYLGVSFFFVLSGFILVWSAVPGDRAWLFYRRRFARVYPSYFAALLIVAVLPTAAEHRGLLPAIVSATLTQGWTTAPHLQFGYDGVSWSLSCEAFFYLLFPLLLAFMTARGGWWNLAPMIVAAYLLAGCAHLAGFDDNINPAARLPEFALGMTAAVAFTRGWRPPIDLRVAAAGLLALLAVLRLGHAPSRVVQLTVPYACVAVVLAAARADAAGRRGWLTNKWLIYAGQVSFCFYLVHEIVIVNLRSHLTGPGAAVIALAVGVAGSVALHHLVELPFQRRLRPPGKPAIGSEGDVESHGDRAERLPA
jgi:peptidoglycan/LPS O-acetylase OafA/YrhL